MGDVTNRLAILGPGTLGRDLALHVASLGWQVDLVGRDEAHAAKALVAMRERVAHLDRPGLLPALSNVSPVGPTRSVLAKADVVFEALPEDLPSKQEAWRLLESLASSGANLFTGTSSLPRRAVSALMQVPARLTVFHPFVPMHHTRLVEFSAADGCAQQALDRASAWGLEAIQVQDGPGLAATRMGLSLGLEAMRLLQEGAASAKDLDRLMVRGYGLPIGPLELSDRIGLDLRLSIARQLHKATGNPCWQPPEILIQAVEEGRLGRKSGHGFYEWPRRKEHA